MAKLGTSVALAAMVAGALAVGAPGTARAAPDTPTSDQVYACRSDLYPAIEGETPEGSHVAGIAEASNGDLLFTFNAHWMEGPEAETKWGLAPVTRVFLSRMAPGETTWTPPEHIDYPRSFQLHNAVLYDDGDGTLFKFFTVLEGMDHTESTLEMRTSTDHGRSWSTSTMIREEWGWMFGTRPLRMSNGEVLVPVYRESFPNGAGFLVSSDGFESWEVYPERTDAWPGQGVAIMASTVELEDGHLLAFLRANGGRILQTHSFDYGRTWTPATQTQLQSPWARVALLKLDSGNLVVAHNPHYSNRAPLQVALSEDGGLTWPHTALIETDPENRFDYPYLEQSSDGFIHVGYTHNDKSNMRHVVFTEEYVRSGPDIPTDVAFGHTEVRDDQVTQVDACAYINGGAEAVTPAGEGETAPAPATDDAPASEPAPLPATGGGVAVLGAVLLGLVGLSTRRGRP